MTIAEWADMMESTIVVHAPSTAARSAFGVLSHSTSGSTFQAHIREGAAKMRTESGAEASVRAVAWVASTSTSAITLRSKITLADGSRPPVVAVEYPRDESGVHHTKVGFG